MIIDYSNKKEIILSNDAFFYLYKEEEPLDDNNIEEALEIAEMFETGFIIEEGWKPIPNSDLIEAVFIPTISAEQDFDMHNILSKDIEVRIKQSGPGRVKAWIYIKSSDKSVDLGEAEIFTNKYGLKCFATGDYANGKGCLFFMKHFVKSAK